LASSRDKQQEDIRLRVMQLVSQNSEISTRQLADKVGISNGSAYYVVTALVEKGFLKLSNFKSNPKKGQYAYLLTPKGIREKSLLAHSFIERKRKEFQDLKAEIKALEEEVGIAGNDITSPRESK
jgi:EPS-associated MarR family transcriptional regulator